MDSVSILGVAVQVIDREQLLAELDHLAEKRTTALVNNVNVHACNLAVRDPFFRSILNASDIVFCDGFGVKLAARLLGHSLGERMTPPDWIDDLFALCAQKGYSVAFVGDAPEVVERFAGVARVRHPGLRIAGFHHGFLDEGEKGRQRMKAVLREWDADVILTGMGMPRQEKWAWGIRDQLEHGVFIATGALFRWYSGTEKRAPGWVTNSGFEWLARWVTSPRRHFRRYVIGLPLFFLRILKQRVHEKIMGHGPSNEEVP